MLLQFLWDCFHEIQLSCPIDTSYQQDRMAFGVFHPWPLNILIHGSFSVSASSAFISISTYFTHIQFCTFQAQQQLFIFFSWHLFILVFSFSIPASCCVHVCVRVSFFFFFCWGWLWGMWKQQGSSLVTHQLWNLSVSRRQREERERQKDTEKATKGERQRENVNKKSISREERYNVL